MAEIILDTNVMGAFLFNEPNTPLAQQVMRHVQSGVLTAFVPSLFWAELQQLCFRKTVAATVPLATAQGQYDAALRFDLVEFGGELVDYRQVAWGLITSLGLGSYDAYFLALALDLAVPVWTFDAKFRNPVQSSPYAGAVLLVGHDVTP